MLMFVDVLLVADAAGTPAVLSMISTFYATIGA